MRMRSAGDEDGSTLPLVIVYGVLSLALILIVVNITSLYLERKRLFTLADAAVLAGAEAYELTEVTVGGAGVSPYLSPQRVSLVVHDYIGSVATNFDDLTVVEATSTEGTTAQVTLASRWHPPVLTVFVPDGLVIDVTVTARSVID